MQGDAPSHKGRRDRAELDPAALEAALSRAPMYGTRALEGDPEPLARTPPQHARDEPLAATGEVPEGRHRNGKEAPRDRPVVPRRTTGRPTDRNGPRPDDPQRAWDDRSRTGGIARQRRAAHEASLPDVQEQDLERLRHHLTAGLSAAGFDRPRLTLHVKSYTGLRASLEQDHPGPFQPGERLSMKLSDGYVQAPEQALQGLGASLGLRMFSKRRRVPELAAMLSEYYDLWQRSQEARDLQSRLRKARGRKQGRGPQGDTYDLAGLTGRVVTSYLGGRIRPVQVTWSTRASYTVLGHHDGDLETIVISKALDHPDVPESVVAYVLYHELLHHVMGIQEGPDHRRLHPPAFRRREQRFPFWAEGDAYLSAMCGRRKPIPRKRARASWHVLWDAPWNTPLPSVDTPPRSTHRISGGTAAARRTQPDTRDAAAAD